MFKPKKIFFNLTWTGTVMWPIWSSHGMSKLTDSASQASHAGHPTVPIGVTIKASKKATGTSYCAAIENENEKLKIMM